MATTASSVATQLAEAGYHPLPIRWGQKGPRVPGWPSYQFNSEMAKSDFGERSNIGLLAKATPFADIDVTDAALSATIEAEALRRWPSSLVRVGQAPKVALILRCDEPFTKLRTEKYDLPDGATGQVEIMCDGQQVVAFGQHPSGVNYVWKNRSPLEVPRCDLPVVTQEEAKDFCDWCEVLLAEAAGVALPEPLPEYDGGNLGKLHGLSKARESSGFQFDTGAGSDFGERTLDEARVLLQFISADDRQVWIDVGMALKAEFGDAAFGLWDQWSSTGRAYKSGEPEQKWKGFNGTGVTFSTIAAMARDGGADLSEIATRAKGKPPKDAAPWPCEKLGVAPATFGWRENAGAKHSDKSSEPTRSFEEMLEAAQALEPGQIEDMEAIVSECVSLNPMRQDAILRAIKGVTKVTLGTLRDQVKLGAGGEKADDLGLARKTLDHIGRENLICVNSFLWRWEQTGVWTEQHDRAVKQEAQAVIQQAVDQVTASLVNGVTDVLKTEIFRPGHEFNQGTPEAVNCLNGEIELQGGCWVLRPHFREHYRTTQIPVKHDRGADAPLFRAFLAQVFRDDPDRDDKTRSILELMGYTLMSHARHERFVMLIGPGANGKSVFLAVLEGLLGHENVAGVQPSNFENRFQRAHLHQKLANIVTELKQGEVIADAELKAITSGEPATVEHKFQNPFVMRPFSTCWFGTNHMPHTRDFSEALFRRATILQFNRTFAPEEQDPLLKEKLLTELPGILNMTLDAYANALTEGFTQPQSSKAAKKEWRLEADQVAQFVDDCCERLEGARAPVADVYRAYEHWANENGIGKTMSQKGLRDRLNRLRFGADRDRKTRYVTGLKVTAISWEA